MEKQVFNEDQGKKFGTWKDTTSDILYRKTIEKIKEEFKGFKRMVDFGGANGLTGQLMGLHKFDNLVIDIDESKKEFGCFIQNNMVKDSVKLPLTMDFGLIRFVLHYLNHVQAFFFIKNVLESGRLNKVLIIQFWNELGDDMLIKGGISREYEEEMKFFRTKVEIIDLIQTVCEIVDGWKLRVEDLFDYEVDQEFYSNRFGKEISCESHNEKVSMFVLERN